MSYSAVGEKLLNIIQKNKTLNKNVWMKLKAKSKPVICRLSAHISFWVTVNISSIAVTVAELETLCLH